MVAYYADVGLQVSDRRRHQTLFRAIPSLAERVKVFKIAVKNGEVTVGVLVVVLQ